MAKKKRLTGMDTSYATNLNKVTNQTWFNKQIIQDIIDNGLGLGVTTFNTRVGNVLPLEGDYAIYYEKRVLTTQGDLLTYGTAAQRLPIGNFGEVLTSNGTTASWAAGSTGTFLSLLDTPNSYAGQAGLSPTVNIGENALEFIAKADLAGSASQAFSVADGALPNDAVNFSQLGDVLGGLSYIGTWTPSPVTNDLLFPFPAEGTLTPIDNGHFWIADAEGYDKDDRPYEVGEWLIFNGVGDGSLGTSWGHQIFTNVNTFEALIDTPDSYVGQAGKLAIVNPGETGIIFSVSIDGYVPYIGATGTLDMGANPVISTSIPAPGADNQLTPKLYVDTLLDTKVPYLGATALLDMGALAVKTIFVPLVDADLTNKLYVDGGFVPYTGANTSIDLNVQNIRSTYVPLIDPDLINKKFLDEEILNINNNFVPYSGALAHTNLGLFNITATEFVGGGVGLTGINFTQLADTPNAYTSPDIGKVAAVNASFDGLEFITPVTFFTQLTDTEPALGTAFQVASINAAGNLIEWVTPDFSPLTTKGDLYGYSTVNARIPVGIDDTYLIADSSETLGLRWGILPPGTFVYLSDTPATMDIGDAGKGLVVNAAGDALEYEDLTTLTDLSAVAPLSYNNVTGVFTHLNGAGQKHIPTGGTVGQVLINTANGTAVWITTGGLSGIGDMVKDTYDTNDNGIVDDSERLGAQLPAFYAPQTALTAHENDTANPHSVTLEQARTALNVLNGDVDFNDNNIIDLKGLGFQDGETLSWDPDFLALNIPTGVGPVLQVGQEFWFLFYNNTGVTIPNGSVIRPAGAATVGAHNYPTPALAMADIFSNCQGTLLIVTYDSPDNSFVFCTKLGRVKDLDTTAFNPGDAVFLSDTVPGGLTNIQVSFPSYHMTVGGVLEVGLTGEIIVNFTQEISDTFVHFWNGMFREPFDFLVESDGAVVTGSLAPSGTAIDLTMMFSDDFQMLDTSPPITIVLTAGTDEIPQINYVYVPVSTKVVTLNLSSWPAEEHIKVAEVLVRTAATTQTKGVRKNHNFNDHIQEDSGQGHLAHITERIRRLDASWESGTEGSVTGLPANAYVQMTGGVVFQIHSQSVTSFSMPTDSISVINDFATPNIDVDDLTDITQDALGNNLNNTSFSIVVWAVLNKGSEKEQMIANLPLNSYSKNTPELAVSDNSGYSIYTIPKEYLGAGFLVARFTFINNGGTWSLYNTQDLRGKLPNTSAGGVVGGGAGVTTFLGLSDTPLNYTGAEEYTVKVNALGTALEFVLESALQVSDIGVTVQGYDVNTTLQGVITKATIGLSEVDNTSDPDKPVSIATQTALDLKEDSLGNPASNGYVLSSTTLGVRSWVVAVSAPTTEMVYGTGTGVTSNSNLVYDDITGVITMRSDKRKQMYFDMTKETGANKIAGFFTDADAKIEIGDGATGSSGTKLSIRMSSYNATDGGIDFQINSTAVGTMTKNDFTLAVPLIVIGTGSFTDQVTIPVTPVADTDASSKKYVDDQVGTAGTIKGSITSTQVAFGATAANEIEGSVDFTFSDASNLLRIGNGTNPNDANFEYKLQLGTNTSKISGMYFQNTNTAGQVRFTAANDVGSYIVMNAYGSTASGTIFGLNRTETMAIFSQSTTNTDQALAIGTFNNGDLVLGTSNVERLRFAASGGIATFLNQVVIPLLPTADAHAASKKYVDDQSLKVDPWGGIWDKSVNNLGAQAADTAEYDCGYFETSTSSNSQTWVKFECQFQSAIGDDGLTQIMIFVAEDDCTMKTIDITGVGRDDLLKIRVVRDLDVVANRRWHILVTFDGNQSGTFYNRIATAFGITKVVYDIQAVPGNITGTLAEIDNPSNAYYYPTVGYLGTGGGGAYSGLNTFIDTATNYNTASLPGDTDKVIVYAAGADDITLDKTGLLTGHRIQLLNNTGIDVSITSSDGIVGPTADLPNQYFAYFTLLTSGEWGASVASLGGGGGGGDAYLANVQEFTAKNTFSDETYMTKVGIGTITPTQTLDVEGNIKHEKSVLVFEENVAVTGTETILSVNALLYDSVFINYTIRSGTNMRAGRMIICTDSTDVSWTDESNAELGDTTPVEMNCRMSGTTLIVEAITSSGTWAVKVDSTIIVI
jgi:hypothetical protein